MRAARAAFQLRLYNCAAVCDKKIHKTHGTANWYVLCWQFRRCTRYSAIFLVFNKVKKIWLDFFNFETSSFVDLRVFICNATIIYNAGCLYCRPCHICDIAPWPLYFMIYTLGVLCTVYAVVRGAGVYMYYSLRPIIPYMGILQCPSPLNRRRGSSRVNQSYESLVGNRLATSLLNSSNISNSLQITSCEFC